MTKSTPIRRHQSKKQKQTLLLKTFQKIKWNANKNKLPVKQLPFSLYKLNDSTKVSQNITQGTNEIHYAFLKLLPKK